MNINIRNAKIDDLSTLLKFEQGVISAERPMDPDLKKDHIQYYDLNDLILSDQVELAVAEVNGIIVGSGYAKILESKPWHNFKKHAYLGFMYTHPDYRGNGINKRIISHLKDWSTSRGIKNLMLDVYHNNPGAIRAYQKVGFETRLVEMRMEISEKKSN